MKNDKGITLLSLVATVVILALLTLVTINIALHRDTITKVKIDNDEFIQNLNEYEKLLSATDDEASLLIIERQILSCYESVVQND